MKLSIITVHYNEVNELARTFESVKWLIDLCDNIEVEWIVIDGATTFLDSDVFIMDSIIEFADYYCSEPDNGIYDAMNKGISHANGEYCIFMNAGDSFSRKLNVMLLECIIINSGAEILYGHSCEIDVNGERNNKISRYIDSLWYGMVTHHQATIFCTKLLRKINYRLNYCIGSDYALISEFYIKKTTFYYCDIFLCDFQLTGVSSNNYFRGLNEQFLIRKRILKINYIFNISIYILKTLSRVFRIYFPKIYKLFRYKNNEKI